jgi:hypothetical protein
MSKFNSREEEYVKNILEQSEKTLKKNEKLKNIDLKSRNRICRTVSNSRSTRVKRSS